MKLFDNDLIKTCAFCQAKMPVNIINQHLLIVHGYGISDNETKCPWCHGFNFHKYDCGRPGKQVDPIENKIIEILEGFDARIKRAEIHKQLYELVRIATESVPECEGNH